jgi:hypothetical protein
LLRIKDEGDKERELRKFVADLRRAPYRDYEM